MMVKMEKRAQDNKREAMQLNLMGKHREALQKISIAIDTDPIIADFHVLRYEVVLRKTTCQQIHSPLFSHLGLIWPVLLRIPKPTFQFSYC